jgi:plastocyanin
MTRWIATPVLSLGLAGLLVACGGDDSGGGSNTVPADADVAVYAIDGIKWDEGSYNATSENGEVTIYTENRSSLAHNLHVKGADDATIGDAVDLPGQGSKGEITVKLEPGEYRIVCLVPGHQNMDSTLIVS